MIALLGNGFRGPAKLGLSLAAFLIVEVVAPKIDPVTGRTAQNIRELLLMTVEERSDL